MAVREGDWEEAGRQMENLRRQKPDTPWLNLVRFELATRHQNWGEASTALSQATAARLLDAPRAKRHQAALMLAAANEETQQGQGDLAIQSAEKAVKQAPDWLPAIITLARKQLATHHVRATLRTIERAWAKKPHPQLAEIYIEAGRGGNPLDVHAKPLEVHKRIERLTRNNPDDPVSHLVLAESALAADLWGEARRHLMMLVSRNEATQTAFRLLAKLERRETGDERAATQWLMKATEAVPDPRWLCSSCGGALDDWRALCAHCGAFNSLEWQTPGIGRNGGTKALRARALDMAG